MSSYSMTEVELSGNLENYNSAKEAIVNGLVREGFLTEDQAEIVNTKYAVVLAKGNWLGQAIGKLFTNKDTQYIKLVKIV